MAESAAPVDAAPARRARKRASDVRIDHQPGFILHSYAWRETSLIVEAFTRDFGRLALVARGAKRPTSQFRGLLSPFSPLSLAWSGRGEVKALVRVEWLGGLAPLRGDGLLAAFYLNELLVRLMPRGDAHPGLFSAYIEALHALEGPDRTRESVLRRFELSLLREMGYAPSLAESVDGAAIDPAGWYRIDAQRGLIAVGGRIDELCVRGSSLRALEQGGPVQPEAAADSKILLRQLIRYHLNGQPLNTRRIFQDLRRLESEPL
jgi:DNA repair protein RecO (recombination protein O)